MKRPLCWLWLLVVSFAPASAVAGQTPVPSHQQAPRRGQAPAKPATPQKPPLVAFVNDVPLRADRLQAAMNELMPYGAYHVGARPERVAEIRKQALDRIIDEELQFQEAKRFGLVAGKADVDREYARVRRRYESEEAFLAALRRAGITSATVRAEAERRALVTAAAEKAVTSHCGVTETDARDYYAQNVSKFVMPEQLHVFTLTVGVDPSAPRDAWNAARKKAEDLLAKLRAGADFEALAREHSTDPNKGDGGDLGYVHRGRLNEEFERALVDAKAGALVGPVQTIYGFHLLRIADIRPPSQRSYEDVRERLHKDLEEKKCTEMRAAWLRDLRERARIVIPEPAGLKAGPGVPIPR